MKQEEVSAIGIEETDDDGSIYLSGHINEVDSVWRWSYVENVTTVTMIPAGSIIT